jgi:uncharacterized protein with NRDE domain
MCLVLVVWRSHADYPCIIAANRDEFHERAAAQAEWWPDHPRIFAGRDLLAGGTWFGMTRAGRFAALTNYRESNRGQQQRADAPSRGALVADFLQSDRKVSGELMHLRRVAAKYNGFNLIFSDGDRLGIYESVRGEGRVLDAGIYGLSNHLLDTPWPKVQRAKSRLQATLTHMNDTASMLEILRDDLPAPDADLPRTGISLEWERLLSSAFVRGSEYGTRCSTVARIDRHGTAFFDEWTWDKSGTEVGRVEARFALVRER